MTTDGSFYLSSSLGVDKLEHITASDNCIPCIMLKPKTCGSDSKKDNAILTHKDVYYGNGNCSDISKQKCNPNVFVDELSSDIRGETSQLEMDLNSSPIASPSKSCLSSSPPRKKKAVSFSEELAREIPSSPVPSSTRKCQTPIKPILKSNTSSEEENTRKIASDRGSPLSTSCDTSPSDPRFWRQGSVILIPFHSSGVRKLIKGSIEMLRNPNFEGKFEVYATLNHLCKTLPFDQVVKLFTNGSGLDTIRTGDASPRLNAATANSSLIKEFCIFVRRDVGEANSAMINMTENKENILSINRSDPFKTRLLSQALKLLGFFMWHPELNIYISIEDIKWVYLHSCNMLQIPSTPKTLLISYLNILKDYRFSGKRKRLIFEGSNEVSLLERILNCVLNMREISSSSLASERFLVFKNLFMKFPVMMTRLFQHWFVPFLQNLCDLASSPNKAIESGILTLMEAARFYLHDRNVTEVVRKLLMTNTIPSGDNKSVNFTQGSRFEQRKVLEYVILKIELLIENNMLKHALDIWKALTLLARIDDQSFGSQLLHKWMDVATNYMTPQVDDVQFAALKSWKALIYNMCRSDSEGLGSKIRLLSDSSRNISRQPILQKVIKPKLKLLLHPFLYSPIDFRDEEVIDEVHNLFLSILYTLFNPQLMNGSMKCFHIFWDKIFEPVLINFYFKKDAATEYMNRLGLEILQRLVRVDYPINERTFNEMRCLSNERIDLGEINSISPRWLLNKFDRILHVMDVVFKLLHLSNKDKLDLLHSFLNNLKTITQKEIRMSETTYDLIASLRTIMNILLDKIELSHDEAKELVDQLNHTFGAANLILVSERDDIHEKNVYVVIVEHCLLSPDFTGIQDLMNHIYLSLGNKKNMLFVMSLVRLEVSSPEIDSFAEKLLSTRNLDLELEVNLAVVASLLEIVPVAYQNFVEQLVLYMEHKELSECEQIIQKCDVLKWRNATFKYYLLVAHNTQNKSILHINNHLISESVKDNRMFFIDMIKFLISNKLTFHIVSLQQLISNNFSNLEGFYKFELRNMWKEYLSSLNDKSDLNMWKNIKQLSEDLDININDIIPSPLKEKDLCNPIAELSDQRKTDILLDDSSSKGNPTEVANKDSNPSSSCKDSEVGKSSAFTHNRQEDSPILCASNKDDNSYEKVETDDAHIDPKESETFKKNSSFDIHSFTSMLNEKLSSGSNPKKRKSRKSALAKRRALAQTDSLSEQLRDKTYSENKCLSNKTDLFHFEKPLPNECLYSEKHYPLDIQLSLNKEEHFEANRLGKRFEHFEAPKHCKRQCGASQNAFEVNTESSQSALIIPASLESEISVERFVESALQPSLEPLSRLQSANKKEHIPNSNVSSEEMAIESPGQLHSLQNKTKLSSAAIPGDSNHSFSRSIAISDKIASVIQGITDPDIAQMPMPERHKLEITLMTFMLRMRNVDLQNNRNNL